MNGAYILAQDAMGKLRSVIFLILKSAPDGLKTCGYFIIKAVHRARWKGFLLTATARRAAMGLRQIRAGHQEKERRSL